MWDESFDFVIIGSGGGSACASLKCKTLGKQALIVEKLDKFGGSTGYSGGVWWLPNNPVMKRAGVNDSLERARTYLNAVATYHGPGSSDARREAFLKTSPEIVNFLESSGMQFRYADGWPDYYDTLPGGEPRGRSLVAPLFDINLLGPWKDKLSMYPGIQMPMGSEEYPILFLAKRTWAGKRMALRLAWRMLSMKLRGQDLRANGAAIQGRLLQIALREGLPIWMQAPVQGFIVENDRVVGVRVLRDGREIRVQARDGVLVNAGGFSRSQEMREAFQSKPNPWKWTNANPGDTGEVLTAAMALGAATDCMNEAWWVITSLAPGETLPDGAVNAAGVAIPFMHHLDLSLPFSMMVDQTGARFCDEAGAYMEIGQRMYALQTATGKAVPSWLIMDSRQRKYYPWGTAAPGKIPQRWLDSGYLKRADSIAELAGICGIDRDGLAHTVTRFNEFCRTGIDTDFGRGSRAFDRAHGDPTVTPNANLGSIEEGPFYAVAMYPGDVGTAGGLVTDEHGRVCRADGTPIEGLYATGNSTASVFGRCYPGAGASIAASLIFAYLAATHASARSQQGTRSETTENAA